MGREREQQQEGPEDRTVGVTVGIGLGRNGWEEREKYEEKKICKRVRKMEREQHKSTNYR